MTKRGIPATVHALRASAAALDASARTGQPDNVRSLLRFYSVECAAKARYITDQLAQPYGNTSAIPDTAFGQSGHDLEAARKALKIGASSVGPAPGLRVAGGSVTIKEAHQVWRYGIHHEGREEADAWMLAFWNWIRETR